LALGASGIYSAHAQEVPDLPVYGIMASISKTPALSLGGGQFFPVQNKLRLADGTYTDGMKLMNEDGEEILLEAKDGASYVAGEVKYSEVYMANWPEFGKWLPVPVILQGPMNIGHVNFASGSATLDSADRQLISAMADEIEHTGLKAIYLVGKADSVGSYEGNLEISRKRVLAVKSYLQNHLAEMGITDVEISTEYMGDLISKSVPDAEDRRVEVTIYPKI
jgi:outer membrane protein OmpA-like peptidoglycan-associated protein